MIELRINQLNNRRLGVDQLMKKIAAMMAGALLSFSLISPAAHAAAYTVQSGDTLWKIATAHNITVEQLLKLNPNASTMLYPGQSLQVPEDPNTYTVKSGDVLWKIAYDHHISVQTLIQANPQLIDPNILNAGDKLCIPVKPASFLDGVFPLKKGTFKPYINNYQETRSWTPNGAEIRAHEGVDIFADEGTPVYAAYSGTIINKGWNTYGGWRLTVRTDSSTAFYYAHMSGYADGLKEGGTVQKGQLIGYVGSTGYGPVGTKGAFLPHLHFGIYRTNISPWKTIDPYSYLTWWGLQ
jgi:peptidoglycan LD-endopeptidase LytH